MLSILLISLTVVPFPLYEIINPAHAVLPLPPTFSPGPMQSEQTQLQWWCRNAWNLSDLFPGNIPPWHGQPARTFSFTLQQSWSPSSARAPPCLWLLAAVRSCVLGGTAPDRWWMVPAGIPPRKQSRAERCWHYLMNESGFLQLAPILLSKGFTLCGESNQWCSGCASAPWTFMEHLWNIYGSGVRQGIMADGSPRPLPCPQRGQRLTGVWMSICTSLQSQTFEVPRWWKTQVI